MQLRIDHFHVTGAMTLPHLKSLIFTMLQPMFVYGDWMAVLHFMHLFAMDEAETHFSLDTQDLMIPGHQVVKHRKGKMLNFLFILFFKCSLATVK